MYEGYTCSPVAGVLEPVLPGAEVLEMTAAAYPVRVVPLSVLRVCVGMGGRIH